MELKERTGMPGEGGGGQLHGRELVDGGQSEAEGKEGGRQGRMRRATFDDLNAIMDINDNVYDGCDYMPTLFYTFMQSKLHIIYVFEEDGKLLSLVNFRLHPDCPDLVTAMSGRVRPGCEGRGLALGPKSHAYAQLLKEHPALKKCVGDKLYLPRISAKMHETKVNYHWNFLVYKRADRTWLNRVTRIRQMALGANRPFSLSYAYGTEWLERSEQLVNFLSKYVTDLFPCGNSWTPTPANRSGLRQMLLNTNVFISMDMIQSTDISYLSDPIFYGGRGPQRTRDRGHKGDLVGLSYSTACPCKHGLRIDIFFYGDSEQLLLSHFYSHLLHYSSITSDDVRFAILVNFPRTIDAKNIDELLTEEMGEMYQGHGVTQSVQHIEDIPHAKL